ncbi:hypothetical protein RFEPED_0410 [Rickettsia felis str. Pedreira]|uniref:Uncharacterized protein n=2 Tax=Rickettsia felis TaxID=42862 RepID=A0A0F3MTW2_RICFI|nr:hypothetical protein [Rickettsia felis]AAY61293.1 unknown [Rickettsia felis URRWXCal2]KHO02809.1 hypothetical protein JS55_02605 [Rickettsia felis str. LSU]KHO03750.1 hypothetical protein JS61_02540 [Rickettsia felis]KJV58039.1 hypothetical protein RFEPED_0410 [Rickettsia felis str. Pedreira]MDE8611991.1 hypothetical protein [Rickettsia felis]
MSKSDASRYLDENKTILCTANNLYKRALEGFNDTNILKEQQGLTHLVMSGYTVARSQLTKALLFGKIDACAGLALFNQQGIGGPVSPYNQKLFLTIGSKFGHPACIQALKNLQNNNCDVEKEANIWVNHINTYKIDLNKEITIKDIQLVDLTLGNALLKNDIRLDTYNAHIHITKTKEEITEAFVPPPAPKPANYYDPHYNKNTTTTTTTNTYVPPTGATKAIR